MSAIRTTSPRAVSAEGPIPSRRGGWRQRRRWAVLLGVIYLVLLMVLALLQEKLIFPGSWTHPHDAPIAVPEDAALATLKIADGTATVALWGRALDRLGRPLPQVAGRRRPTILFFYGNGDHLAAFPDLFEAFRRLGANVCIAEYVGYGAAGGKPSEAGCYATADAAYAFALRQPEVDPQRIIMMGWSLGSGVACDLAARQPPAGLILLSPFTSVVDCAQARFFFLPCRLLVRHRFASLEKIGRIACPIVLIHGTSDHTVPYRMSLALRDAATSARSVEHIPVPGAGHGDLFVTGEQQIFGATRQMVEDVARE